MKKKMMVLKRTVMKGVARTERHQELYVFLPQHLSFKPTSKLTA